MYVFSLSVEERVVVIHRASSCSISGPLLYRPPCFFDRGHPCFRNVNYAIPVDVLRVKSYVNSFLDPTCVPVRISINKLDLIRDRIVAGLVGVFRNGGGLGLGESYIPVVFFDPLLHRSPCFLDVDYAALTGNPVDNTILFSRVEVSFGRTKCDRSFVSDLKTVRMPCCSRQRRRDSETPWT